MNFKFPTDNLYKFISIIGLIFLSYGLISSNKYTDLVYIKTSEIESVWKKIRILDYEHQHPKEITNDTISLLKKSKEDVYKLNLFHKEMEYLISDLEKLSKLESTTKNKNRWISIIGLIIMVIGFFLWYHKTQKKIDLIK